MKCTYAAYILSYRFYFYVDGLWCFNLCVWEWERRGFLSSNLCDVESLIKSAIFSLSYCVSSQKHTLFNNLLRFTAEMSEITGCSVFNMTCFMST